MTYRVVGLLGRGGMAVVELAVDDGGHQVARKRVSLGGSAQQMAVARHRIRREAEILASLDHPGIVPLLSVEDDGTDVVLVMPRMVRSLADRVAAGGPLEPSEVASIGRLLLDALASAHRQGVVHRDIKPDNVLFDGRGRPALADFGVAVTRQFTPGLTSAGMVVGTPEFMAPEQAAGETASAASDVFSLGATLAFALSGCGPYGAGPPQAVMTRAARGQVAPLPKAVPADLRRALSPMLDPRASRRPSAAAALGGPRGTQVDRTRPPRRTVRLTRRQTQVIAAVTAATAGVAVLLAGIALRAGGSPSAGAAPAIAVPTPPTTACAGLRYQPCGQAPAPGTDGTQCLPGHADFDANPANGCEAVSDYNPGTVLTDGRPVLANLVPADAVDVFQTRVTQSFFNPCLTQFRVTLTAPPGTTERVEILRNGEVLASAVSSGMQQATASASKPSCFSSGAASLTVRVTAVAGHSAEDFRLTRNGSW